MRATLSMLVLNVTIILGAIMVAATAAENGFELRAVEPYACKPTLESWHATHGRKVVKVLAEPPGGLHAVVRWDSGTKAEIVVERVVCDGVPGFGVTAERFLGNNET